MNPSTQEVSYPSLSLLDVNTIGFTDLVEEYTAFSPKPSKRKLGKRRLNIALNTTAMAELRENIAESRVSDMPNEYLIYSNGLLLTTDGEIATPEEYNLKEEEIQRQLGNDSLDDNDVMADEGIIQVFPNRDSQILAPIPLTRQQTIVGRGPSWIYTPESRSIDIQDPHFAPVNLGSDINAEEPSDSDTYGCLNNLSAHTVKPYTDISSSSPLPTRIRSNTITLPRLPIPVMIRDNYVSGTFKSDITRQEDNNSLDL
jgi:hypothetical protein